MLSQKEVIDIAQNKEKSCKLCYHFPVCKIYHGFVLNLKSVEVKEIQPDALAKICPFYTGVIAEKVKE